MKEGTAKTPSGRSFSKAETGPHRAYSIARLMKDDHEVKGAKLLLVDGPIDSLAMEEKNRLYHEGLEVIDGITQDALAGEAAATLFAFLRRLTELL